jgi:hypothetical protein
VQDDRRGASAACGAAGAGELTGVAARGSSGGAVREREVDVAAEARSSGGRRRRRAHGWIRRRVSVWADSGGKRTSGGDALHPGGTPQVSAGEQRRLPMRGSYSCLLRGVIRL